MVIYTTRLAQLHLRFHPLEHFDPNRQQIGGEDGNALNMYHHDVQMLQTEDAASAGV